MVTFGIDISHHQDLGLDLAQCRREGIEFVFVKATEGASFVDSEFSANLAEARAAGLLVAAYHYVRASAAASDQVAWISRVIPRDVPVILDVESNSGGIALTRDMVVRLRNAGYSVPLLYLPRWYWQQIGSPSLAGLPPLWSSRYPDNIVGSIADEWADVPATYWNGYGGLPVYVLQFTSSGRVAGHQPLDLNAFNGTRQQLAALLGGGGDDDMPTVNEILMGQMTGTDPTTGKPETHPLQEWLTVQAYRTRDLHQVVPALTTALAAATDDPGVTVDQIGQLLDASVKAHTPTAEQNAAALMPLVESITERVLGADNKDLAAEFLRQLREALPATPEGN